MKDVEIFINNVIYVVNKNKYGFSLKKTDKYGFPSITWL